MLTKKAETRLMKLVKFMESLPKSAEKHFNMSSYIEHGGSGHVHKFPRKLRAKDLHTCGTTACALGWAATMPYFNRLGLSLSKRGINGNDVEIFDLNKCDGLTDKWRALFGSGNRDQTPKEWAQRVRGLLQQWGTRA